MAETLHPAHHSTHKPQRRSQKNERVELRNHNKCGKENGDSPVDQLSHSSLLFVYRRQRRLHGGLQCRTVKQGSWGNTHAARLESARRARMTVATTANPAVIIMVCMVWKWLLHKAACSVGLLFFKNGSSSSVDECRLCYCCCLRRHVLRA
jgi:hypothetical protein